MKIVIFKLCKPEFQFIKAPRYFHALFFSSLLNLNLNVKKNHTHNTHCRFPLFGGKSPTGWKGMHVRHVLPHITTNTLMCGKAFLAHAHPYAGMRDIVHKHACQNSPTLWDSSLAGIPAGMQVTHRDCFSNGIPFNPEA